MSEDLRAEGVAESPAAAIARRAPKARLLHHSDRGVQHARDRYRTFLGENDIACSISRPDNCYDNAVAELFFGTLEDRAGASRARARVTMRARASSSGSSGGRTDTDGGRRWCT